MRKRAKRKKHTFGEASQIYRQRLMMEGRLTRDTELRIDRLLDRFENEFVDEITPLLWHKFMVNAYKHRTAATMQRMLAVMHAIMTVADEMGWVDKKPQLKTPKRGGPKIRTLHLETKEIMPVVEYATLRYGAMVGLGILMLTDTGARWGECIRIRWCDIGEDWVVIRFNEKAGTKTRPRRVPTSPRLLKFLRDHGFSGEPEESVLLSMWGTAKHPRHLAGKIMNALRDAVVALDCKVASDVEDINLHDLRHTFAYQCAEAGADLADLKDMMGHSRVDMTMRYRGFVKLRAREIVLKAMEK